MDQALTTQTERSNGLAESGASRAVAITIVAVIHVAMVLVLVSLSENMAAKQWIPQSLQVNLFKAVPVAKPDVPSPAKSAAAPVNTPKRPTVKLADRSEKAPISEAAPATEQGEVTTAQSSEPPPAVTAVITIPTSQVSSNTGPDAESPIDPTIKTPIKAPIKSPVYERPLLPLNLPSVIKFVAYQGEIEKGAVFGASTYKISATAEGYQASLDIRLNWLVRTLAGGDRAWGSRGGLGDDGLRPAQITEKRGDRPERVTDLDLSAGVQDRVSLIWHFGLLARTFPEKFVSGYEFDQPLRVASRVTNSRWRVTQETLVVQGVSTATLAFTRTDTRDDDFRFDCWLDINERMLPVRLRITGKGYVLDMIKDTGK